MIDKKLKWFAYFCVHDGVIPSTMCKQIADALGDRCELLIFAETIIANNLADQETVQGLIDRSWKKAKGSLPPPKNVFVESMPIQVQVKTRPSAKHEPAVADEAVQPEVALDEPSTVDTRETSLHRQAVTSLRPSEKSTDESNNQPTPSANNGGQVTGVDSVGAASRPPVDAQLEILDGDLGGDQDTPAPQLSEVRPPVSEKLNLGIQVAQLKGKALDFSSLSSVSDDELKPAMANFLMGAQQVRASDIHLSADARPFFRISRKIDFISDHVLTSEESLRLNTALLSESQRTYFQERQDLDFALALDEDHRFRANLMVHKDGVAGTYRVVPDRIMSLEELGFRNADIIRKLLDYHNGLILVTGPVGAGKTTTLASLISELNKKRNDHIISVENPIEIIHHSINCSVTQREVGSHTKSFHAALKGALREDPDIIVIGELRDLETIEMAITAAETGHLVIGTLHTANASTTLNRLLDVFPPAQQPQIRAMTAESLRGVICQRMLPTIEGGVAIACELLLNNLAVSNLIRDGKVHALRAVIETGSKQGMCMMDHYILSLYQQGVISMDVALENMVDRAAKNRVRSFDQFGETGAQTVQASLPGFEAKKKWGLFK